MRTSFGNAACVGRAPAENDAADEAGLRTALRECLGHRPVLIVLDLDS